MESIEVDIRALETRIGEIDANGDENSFLELNGECDQLFARLDGISDRSAGNDAETQKQGRNNYAKLKELSIKLKAKAMINLERLRDGLRPEFGRQNSELFADIDEFVKNGSSSLAMQDIDAYRFELEEIRSIDN